MKYHRSKYVWSDRLRRRYTVITGPWHWFGGSACCRKNSTRHKGENLYNNNEEKKKKKTTTSTRLPPTIILCDINYYVYKYISVDDGISNRTETFLFFSFFAARIYERERKKNYNIFVQRVYCSQTVFVTVCRRETWKRQYYNHQTAVVDHYTLQAIWEDAREKKVIFIPVHYTQHRIGSIMYIHVFTTRRRREVPKRKRVPAQ